MLAISALHGTNQYMLNYFKLEKNKKLFKDYSNIVSEKTINIFTCFVSICLPTYLAYKIYYFRNEFILIEKKYFVMGGLILFIFEYTNSLKNKRKYD